MGTMSDCDVMGIAIGVLVMVNCVVALASAVWVIYNGKRRVCCAKYEFKIVAIAPIMATATVPTKPIWAMVTCVLPMPRGFLSDGLLL